MSLPRDDPYAALRVQSFRWFVASLLAMTIATQIQAVVVAWQIYDRRTAAGSDGGAGS